MPARVASADETIACERETIEAGTPSAELMTRAGRAAAAVIASRYGKAAQHGVIVYAGAGNNGGDGWVVADGLSKAGFQVKVVDVGPPRSPESQEARRIALESHSVRESSEPHGEMLVVDALLGTGSRGAPRGEVAKAVSAINRIRDDGAIVVSLDLPSGVDATTGSCSECINAQATVSFGVLKRGHLIARDACGEITLVDIGLRSNGAIEKLPSLVDDEWVHSRIPPIPADAHKGVRKRLAVVGGGPSMAGAAMLAGQGALRSGIGLLRIYCHPETVTAVHAGLHAAIVNAWPATASELEAVFQNSDCIAIGPGLGNSKETRDLVERILIGWSGPVVMDADALNVFANDFDSLARLLGSRDAVITPHPAELGRLVGSGTAAVLENRFDIGRDLAASLRAAVLLKGTPTVISSPSGARFVSAAGTAALATGGSGDVLTGIIATLLAQMPARGERAADAAACGAFVHGRAAERCRFVRGITLDDVLQALPIVWNEHPRPLSDGILAQLEKPA